MQLPKIPRAAALSISIGLSLALPIGTLAASVDPGGSTGGAQRATAPDRNPIVRQDPAMLAALREQRRVEIQTARTQAAGQSALAVAAACPPIQVYCDVGRTLMAYDITGKVVEPRGSGGYDDNHKAYTDRNYWNFCGAGAVAVAAYYWRPTQLTGRAGANYAEPYGPHVSTTYWLSSDTGTSADTSDGYATKGRGYVMYIAEKTKPPIFSRAGLLDFDTYPSTGAGAQDIVYALNWEISAHSTTYWDDYFYSRKSSSVSQATFVLDVRTDLFDYGAPVVVNLNTYVSSTYHLPNWSRSVGHSITIIGYDDSTDKFTYTDTCGKACNSSSGNHNGGTYTVSYTTMYKLMQNWGTGYAA